MNIIGTGLSGLVGSRIVELLSSSHVFTNLSLEQGIDITDKRAVDQHISEGDAPWVFHLAAYTNVQEAEKEKNLGQESVAWKVNVEATQYIADACRQTQKRLLYIDTDYAFDGTKKFYTEEDATNPLGWYGTTKSEGAKRVTQLGDMGLVVRIANPYRANPVGKTDFVHKMMERLRIGAGISAPSDQLFVPTFIDDIAHAIDRLVQNNASGVYHVVGSTALSPYEAAVAVAQEFGYDPAQITKTTFAEFFANRAPTPQFAALSNEKITKLGVTLHTFSEGLRLMHQQEVTTA